jgi:hypothetical protein
VTGIGIYFLAFISTTDTLTLLPPELSLHILNLLLSPTRPDPRAPAPAVLAALADHAQASSAALLALLSCRAVSRAWGSPRLLQRRLARLLHRPLGCPAFAAYSSLSPLPSEAPPAPARRCLLSSSYPLTRARALLARPLLRAPHPRAPLGVPGCYE